jgi:hypothetical protein
MIFYLRDDLQDIALSSTAVPISRWRWAGSNRLIPPHVRPKIIVPVVPPAAASGGMQGWLPSRGGRARSGRLLDYGRVGPRLALSERGDAVAVGGRGVGVVLRDVRRLLGNTPRCEEGVEAVVAAGLAVVLVEERPESAPPAHVARPPAGEGLAAAEVRQRGGGGSAAWRRWSPTEPRRRRRTAGRRASGWRRWTCGPARRPRPRRRWTRVPFHRRCGEEGGASVVGRRCDGADPRPSVDGVRCCKEIPLMAATAWCWTGMGRSYGLVGLAGRRRISTRGGARGWRGQGSRESRRRCPWDGGGHANPCGGGHANPWDGGGRTERVCTPTIRTYRVVEK